MVLCNTLSLVRTSILIASICVYILEMERSRHPEPLRPRLRRLPLGVPRRPLLPLEHLRHLEELHLNQLLAHHHLGRQVNLAASVSLQHLHRLVDLANHLR